MAKTVLIRPEVAEKYECVLDTDPIVHCSGYNGRLSNVNLAGAEQMEKAGYLKKKPAPKPQKVTSPATTTDEEQK